MTNLDKGIYLESTAEEAVYANVYYGSPRKWIDDMESSEPFVAMPANAFILSALCKTLEEREKRNNVIWANLTAPLEIRRSRIEHRVKDQKSLEIRLHSGVTQGILADADVNIDTSIHDPTQVLDIITTITR